MTDLERRITTDGCVDDRMWTIRLWAQIERYIQYITPFLAPKPAAMRIASTYLSINETRRTKGAHIHADAWKPISEISMAVIHGGGKGAYAGSLVFESNGSRIGVCDRRLRIGCCMTHDNVITD